MILRWLLLGLAIFLVRRIVLTLFGKRGARPERMGGRQARQTRANPPPDKSGKKPREDEIAAGQRIEEADFEELD